MLVGMSLESSFYWNYLWTFSSQYVSVVHSFMLFSACTVQCNICMSHFCYKRDVRLSVKLVDFDPTDLTIY